MDTKEKIMLATLALAGEQGLGNVSLSQIAQRTGIRKASLYSHYPSKQAIIAALYTYVRENARQRSHVEIDYGKLVEGKTAQQALHLAVSSYETMTQDPQLRQFYRFIESERVFSPEAARIAVKETETMILATKQLLYAMQVHGLVHCEEIDTAAALFAMEIHAILNYRIDRALAGFSDGDSLLDRCIDQFCSIYGKEETK